MKVLIDYLITIFLAALGLGALAFLSIFLLERLPDASN